MCFAFHRYKRLHDNLIKCFIYNVRRYNDEAKERVYELRFENNQILSKASRVLKLFTDDGIAENAMFQSVQAKAFVILERRKLDYIADHIAAQFSFDETALRWQEMDQLAGQFKRNIRPILQRVEWAAISARTPLIEAIAFLKMAFQK